MACAGAAWQTCFCVKSRKSGLLEGLAHSAGWPEPVDGGWMWLKDNLAVSLVMRFWRWLR